MDTDTDTDMDTDMEKKNKTILVTGSPGFIGANLVMRLLGDNFVISVDNMNGYYDPRLKEYRLRKIEEKGGNHLFLRGDISDLNFLEKVFGHYRPDIVVNLAAQAGVRYSIDHPRTYIDSNIIGFFNILEMCRKYPVEHLIYASSSSVYGGNKKIPFSTDDKVDNPVSLYAATKKSDELLAHCYTKLYGIPTTGLRFFTVYGPAGRPDMFYYSAADKLVRREPIKIFNYGKCKRDFTYIDDIVEGIVRIVKTPPLRPYSIYNIGGGQPENLMDFIQVLKEELTRAGVLPEGYVADEEFVGMQPGDVPVTYADSSGLEKDYGFKPQTGIREGLKNFANWYREYREEEI